MKTPIKLFQALVVFLPLFFLSSFSLAISAEKGVFITDEVQLKIAEAFMEEGEYYRAVTEYKKLLILFPDSEWADYALFRMGIAYYNGEEYASSVRSFSALRDKYPESSYIPEGYYFEGLGYWKLKRFKEARAAFDALAEDYPQSEHAPLALVAASLVGLEEGNIPLSTDRLERLINQYPEYPVSTKAKEAIPMIGQYQRLPEKSKTLAAILSAIIPGSGYIYAGHWGDGITAFLINALWIAGVATGIHSGYYAVCGILAGVGLPFYFGNIYGSANAAKKWNLGVKMDFRNRVYLTLEFNF
jgi:outer membrane protein assembly factor BamD (BamD/ComL family)/TM2 domain-containing membrane protein YozV